jgi:hypothetical protein
MTLDQRWQANIDAVQEAKRALAAAAAAVVEADQAHARLYAPLMRKHLLGALSVDEVDQLEAAMNATRQARMAKAVAEVAHAAAKERFKAGVV